MDSCCSQFVFKLNKQKIFFLSFLSLTIFKKNKMQTLEMKKNVQQRKMFKITIVFLKVIRISIGENKRVFIFEKWKIYGSFLKYKELFVLTYVKLCFELHTKYKTNILRGVIYTKMCWTFQFMLNYTMITLNICLYL